LRIYPEPLLVRLLPFTWGVVVSDTGAAFHMFECHCGERIWID